MTLTQQWRHLNIIRNGFSSYFLRKVVWVIVSIPFLAVSTFVLKELVHSLAENFQTSVNELHIVNVNCLKSPKKTGLPSPEVLGGVGVGFLRTLGVGVGFFSPTPEVQLNNFIHCTPKLRILTRACWNGTIAFEIFIETEFLLCTTISIDC